MYHYLFCCWSFNLFKVLIFVVTSHYTIDSLCYFWQSIGRLAETKQEFATNVVLAAELSRLMHADGQMACPETTITNVDKRRNPAMKTAVYHTSKKNKIWVKYLFGFVLPKIRFINIDHKDVTQLPTNGRWQNTTVAYISHRAHIHMYSLKCHMGAGHTFSYHSLN